MKYLLLVFLLTTSAAFSQTPGCENVFIITTDGFRWQELFNGADSAILFNPRYVKDIETMKSVYWANSEEERRKILMPFTWSYIAKHGQLWGNRKYENEISVANPYRISYPGYNEILTGYADRGIKLNKAKLNPNINILSYLNSLPAFKNKVAAFASWNVFPYIFNSLKDSIAMNAGYQLVGEDSLSATESAVNAIQQYSQYNGQPTRSDLLTFTVATEYIRTKHPRVVFIGFGETDEFAHRGEYDHYLQQAKLFDTFLEQLWSLIQREECYRNKTTIIITTDHGRGRKASNWKQHGPITPGSKETWIMQLGPNIQPLGEVKANAEIDNEQLAQTIAYYLGEVFETKHPVGELSYVLAGINQ